MEKKTRRLWFVEPFRFGSEKLPKILSDSTHPALVAEKMRLRLGGISQAEPTAVPVAGSPC